MNITQFSDLLAAAKQQPEPQRLLMVFACAELPKDATAEEIAQFERGEGGSLKPVLCVDKLPEEITDFPALVAEAARTGMSWEIVLVAGMSGRGGVVPSSDEAEQPLKMMVGAIESGHIGQFLAFDKQGDVLSIS